MIENVFDSILRVLPKKMLRKLDLSEPILTETLNTFHNCF